MSRPNPTDPLSLVPPRAQPEHVSVSADEQRGSDDPRSPDDRSVRAEKSLYYALEGSFKRYGIHR